MPEKSNYFDLYRMFLSLKLHFTKADYDYTKFGYKHITENFSAFKVKREAKYFFQLSMKYNIDECEKFFISNFVYDDPKWINDIMCQEGKDNLQKYQKIHESIRYTFQKDLQFMENKEMYFADANVMDILNLVYSKKIELETFIIANECFGGGIFEEIDKENKDTVLWPKIKFKCQKYVPFIIFDEDTSRFDKILEGYYENVV